MSEAKKHKNLIKILRDFIAELKREPEMSVAVPLHFQYRGKPYDGVGVPMMSGCHDGICDQLDITLNKKHLGVLKCTKNGWRLADMPLGLAKAIGERVFEWYE